MSSGRSLPGLDDYTRPSFNDPFRSRRFVDCQEFIEIPDLFMPARLNRFQTGEPTSLLFSRIPLALCSLSAAEMSWASAGLS
jgi:hypothetical protein